MNPFTLNILFMVGCGLIAITHAFHKNYGQVWYWLSAASITGAVTWGLE